MIDHREALTLAAAAVDWPLTPDEEADLHDHLTRCAACRTAAAALRTDAARLRALPRRDAPERVGVAVRAAASGRPRSSSRLVLVLATSLLLVATALGGLFAAGALVPRRDERPSDPPRSPVASPTTPPTAVAPPTPRPTPATSPTPPGPGSGFRPRTGEQWVRVADRRVLGRDARVRALGAAPGFGVFAVGTSGGNAGAWFSRNGRQWRAATRIERSRGATMVAAGASAAGAVAIGTIADGSAAVWRTRDGLRWTLDQPTELRGATLRVVAVGARGFVIGGDRSDALPRASRIWFSSDGARWVPALDVDVVHDVAVGPEGFAAVGCERGAGNACMPRAWKSPDGRFWTTARIAAPSVPITRVVATERGFAAFAREPLLSGETVLRVWISRDGLSWRVADPPRLAGASSRAFATRDGPGVLVLRDENGGRRRLELSTSVDGRAWSYVAATLAFEAVPHATVTPTGDIVVEAATSSGPSFWITPAEPGR